MSRRYTAVFVLGLCWAAGQAQTFQVTVAVDPVGDTSRISPYIYGTNGQSNDRSLNITARRLGGNRMTGYNWENNASNMGMDYNQSNANDNYMTWVAGIPLGKENTPGITLTTFHDTSLAMNCYSLITLPAAGFVSRDKDGSVTAGQAAPSGRFRAVVPRKGAPLAISPDTSDGFVYVDEEVNFLTSRYGTAATATGVKGYDVDNEPALWPSTHPRIHPAQTTCVEVIGKTVVAARAVKSVDPGAEIFGGVFYGFNEYYSMQNASDYTAKFAAQGWFINGYLKALHDSSVAAGIRLLDVLDLHWYPDLYTPIVNGNTDSATVAARLQAPRSLWDSSYVESGWIGQWFSPVSMIRNVQTSITKNYPGTKLSISEYDYGASAHISGGIAQTDVLGIFGAYRVYMATHWGSIDGFLRPAYSIFRNYDGKNGMFGDMHVRAATTNAASSSAYASTHSNDANTADLVLINKDVARTMQTSVTIAGSVQYHSARDFGFDASHQTVTEFNPIPSITGNAFTVSLPPLSVHHLVLSTQATGIEGESDLPQTVVLEQNYPNPFNPTTVVSYQLSTIGEVTLVLFDLLGREIAVLDEGVRSAGRHEVRFDGSRLSSGIYFYRLTAGGKTMTRSMSLVK
jgi:mannan endo-1,4-beta-mannosidase